MGFYLTTMLFKSLEPSVYWVRFSLSTVTQLSLLRQLQLVLLGY